MTARITSLLAPHFRQMRVVDTSEGTSGRWLQILTKLWRSARAMWSVRRSDAVYLSVNGGRGMWLTTVTATLARAAGAKVFLHHHSYAYVRERSLRMVALSRAAGSGAYHIVLSPAMASDLTHLIPEIRNTPICGPAWSIDRSLLELPLRADNAELVLGHLSILIPEKGLAEVVDLAVALHRANTRVRLLVAGPAYSRETQHQLDRAARELGGFFEYRGLLAGEPKRQFFGEITHFILPSRYEREAVPVVLFEAMAAGAICVATKQGLIAEQLEGSPSILATSADSFVEETLPKLIDSSTSTATSQASREAFLAALFKSEEHLAELISLMATRR